MYNFALFYLYISLKNVIITNNKKVYKNSKEVKIIERILITGASSGIGKELAKNLANNTKKLFLLARSLDKLNLLKKELEEKFSSLECICMKYDLTNINNLENIVENCDVDLVINCAGFGKITDFLKLSNKEDLDTINVNFISPLILTKKLSEKFLQKGQGTILNVCSTAALYQHPYMAVYSSTKSALLHYSLALDEELSHKNKNVRVLSVCPGPTASNFFDKDIQEKFGSSQKFMMSSEDVARRIIKAIEKKKRFSIIGFRNKLSMFLINLLPISLQLKLVGLILKKVIK